MTHRSENGFTLLELMVSLTIIALLITVSAGAVRLGVTTQEIGEQKAETYQRLRFIGNQLTQKIRSLQPLFVRPVEKTLFAELNSGNAQPPKYLAFDGTSDSIKFITFSHDLSSTGPSPEMHETQIYLGTHPKTQETGILMMERKVSFEDPLQERPEDARYVVLASEVAYLKFRYYQVHPVSPEERQNPGKNVKYLGEWVDRINTRSASFSGDLTAGEARSAESERLKRISLPRAIEVSLGLWEPASRTDNDADPRLVVLPPTIITLNTGIAFERPEELARAAS